jgi:pyruvate,orthophosphate dikinase
MSPVAATGLRLVYDFAAGSREMRDLLGGKGAGVAEMTRVLGADRVPAGFTIATAACGAYLSAGGEMPAGLEEQVAAALGRLEQRAGKRLGDPADPLLVSVRSGARESMPGMLDTVLNLGLSDASVEGLAAATGDARFAWDSYRRFAQMFGNVCHGIAGERYEALIAAAKRAAGVHEDTGLDAAALRELTAEFKALFAAETGEEFPQDPAVQLRQAIAAVFDSWKGERAIAYRRLAGIPDEWGTAVNVQQMVFGNRGADPCSGVAFSRDDVEGRILDTYIATGILDRSPFETIDRPGVGWLVRLAAWVGREAEPGLELGVCGEHAGDPDSIAFFALAGVDYVSCSPYRVPIARVAAAQANQEER